jgi:hypothetical protein
MRTGSFHKNNMSLFFSSNFIFSSSFWYFLHTHPHFIGSYFNFNFNDNFSVVLSINFSFLPLLHVLIPILFIILECCDRKIHIQALLSYSKSILDDRKEDHVKPAWNLFIPLYSVLYTTLFMYFFVINFFNALKKQEDADEFDYMFFNDSNIDLSKKYSGNKISLFLLPLILHFYSVISVIIEIFCVVAVNGREVCFFFLNFLFR